MLDLDTATFQRMMKGTVDADHAGTVCAVYNTPERTNTCAGGTTSYATLDGAASSTDDEYLGMVIIVSVDGVDEIREIVSYDGTNKYAYVNMAFTAAIDNDDGYDIYEGIVFDRYSAGYQIGKVVRPWYNCASEAPGGAEKLLHELVYFYNKNTTTSLTSAEISIPSGGDPTALVDFVLGDALSDTYVTTTTNRLTAPAGTFNDTAKVVVGGGNLTPEIGQPVWLRLTLAIAASAQNSFVRPAVGGQTS